MRVIRILCLTLKSLWKCKFQQPKGPEGREEVPGVETIHGVWRGGVGGRLMEGLGEKGAVGLNRVWEGQRETSGHVVIREDQSEGCLGRDLEK